MSDQLSVASRSPSTRGRYTEALVSQYYTPGSPAAAFMPVASDPRGRKVSAGPTVGKLAESDRWVGLERFPTVPWCGPEYSRSPCRERALFRRSKCRWTRLAASSSPSAADPRRSQIARAHRRSRICHLMGQLIAEIEVVLMICVWNAMDHLEPTKWRRTMPERAHRWAASFSGVTPSEPQMRPNRLRTFLTGCAMAV